MSAQNRANKFLGHLSGNKDAPVVAPQYVSGSSRADDVVIVSALRTAIGRARKGSFAQSYIEDMLAPVLKATIEKTGIDAAIIDDIVVGNVLGGGSQRANECRIASLMAGIPETVPVHVVNRQCSSGLQALAHVAANIKAGFYDVGLACGVENMSTSKFKWEGSVNPKVMEHKQAKACLIPMGITSENVAAKYNITRAEQDQLAAMSHARAAKAIKTGRFKDEIVPVEVTLKDKEGKEHKHVIANDEGCRPGTTVESLGKLRAVFKKDGSTTAGNASQVSDGAAVVLAMRRSVAEKLGLKVMGVFRSAAVVGVDPAVMGIGPAVAIPAAVKKAGLKLEDIDLFEINEAFASQATYCVKKLGLSWDKVNVNGGAIAIGHPLGMTGARMVATLLHEMEKRGDRYGAISMCIGSGMGMCGIIERE